MKECIDLIMVCAGSQGPTDKSHIPLGLLYVGSALERAGFDVKVWHLLPDEFESALIDISKRKSLWIGLSVLSGMTTYHAAKLSKRIKELIPASSIVWGGHHASAVPAECLKERYVDYVICGEGEDTAVELTKALCASADLSAVLSLGYKATDGTPILNKNRPLVEDIDQYEINWELLDISDYINPGINGKIPMSFYSSRGCPFQCTFCATPLYTGSSFRAHSPEFVLKNLVYMKDKYNFNSVFFSDDNFMIDPDRGLKIIRLLREEDISVDTLDVRLNQIDQQILSEFKNYGVSGIFFGYESGSERILKLMNKGMDLSHIKRKVELIAKSGIDVWASGIMGVPTETRQEVYETIDFSMWLRDKLPGRSTVSVYRYMPLPKTRLLQLAIEEGFPYPENSEDWKKIDPIGPYFNMQSWLKWLTPEDERYLAIVQELSRNKMLNYMHGNFVLADTVNNLFVRRARSKLASRKLSWDIEFKTFELMRDIYSRVRYGKSLGIKSEALTHNE
jgi:radical SAM superfamily enzyme YgiQ (UPF0313 family)